MSIGLRACAPVGVKRKPRMIRLAKCGRNAMNNCTCPGLEAVGISPEEQKDVLCAVCNPDLTCEVCGETGHVYCHEECGGNK